MNNKLKYGLWIFVGLLVLSGGIFYFVHKQKIKNFQTSSKPEQAIEKNYDTKGEKPESKPLDIPKEKIQTGRTAVVPIFMYHHIGEPPKDAGKVRIDLTVSVSDFEQEAKWLSEQGYHTITLQNLYDFSKGQFELPKKPIIFTFDDGYDDVFQNAIPILDKYGFKGSFAIITQYPKSVQGDNFYASWDEIKQAYLDGHEIVSHTQDHFDGSNKKYTSNFIFTNLSGSISDIYEHLNIKTNILIYPYGHYTPDYIVQAKKTGFIMGVTVHEGDLINLDNLMEVPRIRVHHAEPLERFVDIVLHKQAKASTTTTSLSHP